MQSTSLKRCQSNESNYDLISDRLKDEMSELIKSKRDNIENKEVTDKFPFLTSQKSSSSPNLFQGLKLSRIKGEKKQS